MMIKSHDWLCSFLSPLFVISLASNLGAEEIAPKPIEKLGSAKIQEMHMTKEQADAAKKGEIENFEQAFKGSTPEVQQAILKAAKELDAKKKATAEKSAEQ